MVGIPPRYQYDILSAQRAPNAKYYPMRYIGRVLPLLFQYEKRYCLSLEFAKGPFNAQRYPVNDYSPLFC
jgi:hypothetical protein